TGVPGSDDNEAEPEIDMRGSPRLQRPEIARHPALAIAKRREPENQQRADCAEGVAVPAAAIRPGADIDQRIGNDDEQTQSARNLGPAKIGMAQKALVPPLAYAFGLGRRCAAPAK